MIRAITRLSDQRVLTNIVGNDAEKEGGENASMVEVMLARLPLAERPDSCFDTCRRAWYVRSSGCCCRSLYESTMNVVMTAENKPL